MLLDHSAGSFEALAAQVISSASTVLGTGVDVTNVEGNLLVALTVAATNSAGTVTVTMQHNTVLTSGDSGWADVPAEVIFDPSTGKTSALAVVTGTASSFQQRGLRRERLKRYVRAKVVVAGATPTVYIANILFGDFKYTSNW